MDPGTISAIIALTVALLALFIAFAQVAQQYASTAVLMRKCDSIVFGRLPGGGKRVWVGRQLRFKVVYSMPRISLDGTLWATNSAHPSGYLDDSSITKKTLPEFDAQPKSVILRRRFGRKLPKPDDLETPVTDSVEASWASFCRACQPSCGTSLQYHMVSGDVDRCPDDLPVIPMQVSFRDVIVLALRSGMRIVMRTEHTSSFTIQGKIGTITSAQHPILGLILHFTPRGPGDDFGLSSDKKVSLAWMARLWGDCAVANRRYTERERRREEGFMLSKASKLPIPDEGGHSGEGGKQPFSDLPEMGVAPRDLLRAQKASSRTYDEISRGVGDGQWTIETPEVVPESLNKGETSKSPDLETVNGADASKMPGELGKKDAPSVSPPKIPSNSMPETSQNQDHPTLSEKEGVHMDDSAMSPPLRGAVHINDSTTAPETQKPGSGDIRMESQTEGESKSNRDQNAAAQSDKASEKSGIGRKWAVALRSPPKPWEDIHLTDSDRFPDSNEKGLKSVSNDRRQAEPKVDQEDENLRGLAIPLKPPQSSPETKQVDRLGPRDTENRQHAENPDHVANPTGRENSFTQELPKLPSDPIRSTSTSKKFDDEFMYFRGNYRLEQEVKRERLRLERAEYRQKRRQIEAETAEQARLSKITALEQFDAEIVQRRKHREAVAREQKETDLEHVGRARQTEIMRLQLHEDLRMQAMGMNARVAKEKLLVDTEATRHKTEEAVRLRKEKEELEERIEPIYLTDPDGNSFKLPFRKFKRSRAMAVALQEWPPLQVQLASHQGSWYQLLGPDGHPIFPGAWSGVVVPGIEIKLVYKSFPVPQGQEQREWSHVANDVYLDALRARVLERENNSTDLSETEWLQHERDNNRSRGGSDGDNDSLVSGDDARGGLGESEDDNESGPGDSTNNSDSSSGTSIVPRERRTFWQIFTGIGNIGRSPRVEEDRYFRDTGVVREENALRRMIRGISGISRSPRVEEDQYFGDAGVVIEESAPRRMIRGITGINRSPRVDLDDSSGDEVVVIEEHSPPRRRPRPNIAHGQRRRA